MLTGNLVSFKSRNTVQEDEAQFVIEKTMREAGQDVTYGFTHDSYRENSGPCDAGACLFFPNQEKLNYINQYQKIFYSSRRTGGH